MRNDSFPVFEGLVSKKNANGNTFLGVLYMAQL